LANGNRRRSRPRHHRCRRRRRRGIIQPRQNQNSNSNSISLWAFAYTLSTEAYTQSHSFHIYILLRGRGKQDAVGKSERRADPKGALLVQSGLPFFLPHQALPPFPTSFPQMCLPRRCGFNRVEEEVLVECNQLARVV
jgi:hypothetical protein